MGHLAKGNTQTSVVLSEATLKRASKLTKRLGARSRGQVLSIAIDYGLNRIDSLLALRDVYQDLARDRGQESELPPGALQLSFLEALDQHYEAKRDEGL